MLAFATVSQARQEGIGMKHPMKAALASVLALTASSIALAQMPKASSPNVIITQTTAPNTDLKSAKRISREDAEKLVKQGKAVYVDVRGADQYATGHIKGAMTIPESELIARFREIPPGKKIITYCA